MGKTPHYERGNYRCRITSQGLGKSREKKTDYFFIEFLPVAKIRPDGSESLCESGYKRNYDRFLTENTKEYALGDLDFLGFEGNSFGQINLDHPQCFNMTGMEIEMYCTHEVNGENTYERWHLNTGGGGREIIPATQNDVRKLDALFGSDLRLRATKRKSQPSTRQAAPAQAGYGGGDDYASGVVGDDEIPF